ncbi:hypothetical protein RFI_40341 [Reticulomyxa filosa]|uniref:Karyopherin beta n=1 Tax=Reticulomyxa filosa TaxID=46433 RepID=X6L7C9_RETFI|nr:hypothetical protein RFI_40341 [Reticulomyxa filosa]|eukprot:ETN97193.1 hypothetical protein RFI_40341 [Reticulomyxa filosa]
MKKIEKEKALGGVSYNFMMKLFNRLSEVLEGDFVRYLQHIIPPLIKSAQLNPTSMSDAKDPDEIGISCQGSVISTSVHLHAFGSKKISVNTSEVEEKTIACKLLVSYASHLEGGFLEYAKTVTKVMKPLLEYKCHHNIRRSAAESVPVLLRCIVSGLRGKEADKDAVTNAVSAYIKEVMMPFVRCMEIEDEVEPFTNMCGYLVQVLECVDELKIDACRFISEDMVRDMAQQITNAISERILRHFNQEELGDDAAAEEYSEDIEAELADNVLSDIVSKLCKLFGSRFVEIFDKVCAEQVKELVDQSQFVDSDHILGLTIFTEVIRYGQKLAAKYTSFVLKTCQQVLQKTDASDGLRQSAAYAIGICSDQQLLSDADQWLKELKHLVDMPGSREDDHVLATENAISAIGKICRNQSKQIEDWNKKGRRLDSNAALDQRH